MQQTPKLHPVRIRQTGAGFAFRTPLRIRPPQARCEAVREAAPRRYWDENLRCSAAGFGVQHCSGRGTALLELGHSAAGRSPTGATFGAQPHSPLTRRGPSLPGATVRAVAPSSRTARRGRAPPAARRRLLGNPTGRAAVGETRQPPASPLQPSQHPDHNSSIHPRRHLPHGATPGGPRVLTAAQQQPQQQPKDGERRGHGSAPSATQLRAAPRRSPHPACDSPTAAERGGTGPDGAASGGARGAERGQRGFGASEGAVGSGGRLEGLRGVLGAPRGVVVPPGVVLEVPGGVPRHCEALQGIKEVTIRCQGGSGETCLILGRWGGLHRAQRPRTCPSPLADGRECTQVPALVYIPLLLLGPMA